MKFAKELQEDLVAEWRLKYLDYKQGKKKVKAVARAKNSSTTKLLRTPAINRRARTPEQQPLQANGIRYGSIEPETTASATTFRLPEPALTPAGSRDLDRVSSGGEDAYEVGPTHKPTSPKAREFLKHRRTVSTPRNGFSTPAPFVKRMFSFGRPDAPLNSPDVSLEITNELDRRKLEFKSFLDAELTKIEEFYKSKEIQAGRKLIELKEQLHILKSGSTNNTQEPDRHGGSSSAQNGSFRPSSTATSLQWLRPIENAIVGAPGNHPRKGERSKDYSRKPPKATTPDKEAIRQLKLALKEYYRGLELLRSYALLNRTAFRKINKKYDKALGEKKEPLSFMASIVNRSYFVKSEKVDDLLREVEGLYAEYLVSGKDASANHKVAIRKLRSKTKVRTYSGSTFRNGIFLGIGTPLGVIGLIFAGQLLVDKNTDPTVRIDTSYLLQLYAGYFLALCLTMLFTLVCSIWTRARINYVFIFEFDSRHNLDWRQLAELPSLFWFFLGFSMFLNFWQPGPGHYMFRYWPAILVSATVVFLIVPLKILYYRSRIWWIESNFRLLLAGAYGVEFRDFFLGDMFCSLTYAMGNIEVFFCLYATHWSDPTQCNSSHSRTLGFLSTLPGIWRAMQCLRRYYDTRNKWPHLVNFGKYTATIAFYASLSAYRIREVNQYYALFITFGTINSIYVSVWDIAMDWSLLDPNAADYPFLRDVLGYEYIWPYYLAIVVDPILRFNWVLYLIVSHELQHSALLSFFIAFSEIFRRGMWTIFRVENEHCTNVGRFRASRDIPLPFECEPTPITDSPTPTTTQETPGSAHLDGTTANGADLEQAPTSQSQHSHPTPGELRRRRTMPSPNISGGLSRVGTAMATAHAADFERKRAPAYRSTEADEDEDSSDEDDGSEGKDREEIGTAREISRGFGGQSTGEGRRS